jgi:regulator of protease activity HflC (stomatin/prohibitin superfamily)
MKNMLKLYFALLFSTVYANASGYQSLEIEEPSINNRKETKVIINPSVVIPSTTSENIIRPARWSLWCCLPVSEGFVAVKEVFEAFSGIAGSGLNCVFPCITSYRMVNTKSIMRTLPKISLSSFDNRKLEVQGSYTFKVTEADKAVYQSDNVEAAMINFILQSITKHMQPKKEDEAIKPEWRDELKKLVMKDCSEFTGYGINIQDVSISKIAMPQDLIDAQHKKRVLDETKEVEILELKTKSEKELLVEKQKQEKLNMEKIQQAETKKKIEEIELQQKLTNEKISFQLEETLREKESKKKLEEAKLQSEIKLIQSEAQQKENGKKLENEQKQKEIEFKSQLQNKELTLQAQLKEEELKTKIAEQQSKQKSFEAEVKKKENEVLDNPNVFALQLMDKYVELQKHLAESKKHVSGAHYYLAKEGDEKSEDKTPLGQIFGKLIERTVEKLNSNE